MKVLVFEGGEFVTDEENLFHIDSWTEENILELLERWNGKEWLDEDVSELVVDEDGPKTIRDTLDIMSENFAQITADSIDGGMVYIVHDPS